MQDQKTLAWHIRRTIALGLPVVASQILQILIGVTDSVMVARLGELPLAQVTLGSQVLFFAIIIAVGFSIPIMAILSKAIENGEHDRFREVTRTGLLQAIILSVAFLVMLQFTRNILEIFDQEEAVIEGAVRYINIAMWSLPMICVAGNFRSYLLALERNAILMRIALLGVLVNALVNYVLIFGHFGAPALGLEGAAWATLFTNTAMLIAILFIVHKESITERVRLWSAPLKLNFRLFWHLVALALPATFGLLSEVGMFQGATLMMGRLGVSELAAYGLVLQIASLTFMIPLGFSIVASVRAGKAQASGDRHALMMVAKSVTIVITLTMVCTALIFLIAPHRLLSLLLDTERADAERIMTLGVIYLSYAAAFQVVDGAQVAAMSLLRGMLDMFWPSIFAFVSYICVGLSVGYYLAFYAGWEGQGVWMGLVIGLSLAAVLLWGRFFWKTRTENFS